MKRTIIIGGIVLIVAVVGAIIFFALHASGPSALTTGGSTGKLPSTANQGANGGSAGTGNSGTAGDTQGANGGGITTAGDQSLGGAAAQIKGFGPVSNDPVIAYFVDPQNNVYIIKTTGVISKITNGQSADLSSLQIQGLLDAGFSFDGKKALVSFGDPAAPQTSVFDIATKSWTALPKGLISPKWSPADTRIAYIATPSTGILNVDVIDAANLKRAPVALTTLHAQDWTLSWFDKSHLILSDRPSALEAGSSLLYDMVKQTLTPIVNGENGSESIWSGASSSTPPVGLVFMSGPANRGGELRLQDISDSNSRNLNILTLPSKCAFSIERLPTSTATSTPAAATTTTSSTTTSTVKKITTTKAPPPPPTYTFLYCAVPRDQNTLAFSYLPDDYEQMAIFTADDILKVNVTTGSIEPVFSDQSQQIDATKMKFVNNSLFMINRYDNKLYAVLFNG